MKKTLVALAALAATSAFAAPTITGSYAFAYRATTNVASASGDKSGFGVDTSALTFADTEDLGGGMSVTTSLGFDGIDRTNTGTSGVFGDDSSIALSGGFGKLTLGAGQGSDYLSGAWVGLDGKVFSGKTTSDSVSYALPAFGGVTVSFTHAENDGAASVGEGNGATGSQLQRNNTISVSYAAGGLSANVGLRSYDQSSGTGDVSKSLARAKVAYDFGSAKVGGGFVQLTMGTGTRTDALIGASTSFGNLSIVGDLATRTYSDSTAANTNADGTKHGYGLQAEYALSKRTSVGAAYKSWQGTSTTGYTTGEFTAYLGHSF